MENNFLSIEDFNELLNRWKGLQVKITKHELEDLDEVLLDLNKISYSKDTSRLDEYEAMHTLELNGMGQILTEENTYRPLPASIYEIPVEDTTLYEFDGSCFIISTIRAIYKIELYE